MVILFVRSLVITASTVAIIDAIVFYLVWNGQATITPLFVISVIIVTTVVIAINLWVHIVKGVNLVLK